MGLVVSTRTDNSQPSLMQNKLWEKHISNLNSVGLENQRRWIQMECSKFHAVINTIVEKRVS